MEFNFDFRRLLLLSVLLGGFALFGGFSKPKLPSESMHGSTRVHKAWFYCVALFVIGAASASLVDHWAGTMEPVNLRTVYVLLGVLLMTAGSLWLRSLKQAVEQPPATMAGTIQTMPCYLTT